MNLSLIFEFFYYSFLHGLFTCCLGGTAKRKDMFPQFEYTSIIGMSE